MRARFLLLLIATSSCLGDFNVEKQTYPCRTQADCIKGYACHPTRYICVPSGSVDASVSAILIADGSIFSGPDSGPDGSNDGGQSGARLTIGSICAPGTTCDEGTCVDGRCCESACTEQCMRCDLPANPGRCLPSAVNTDPDGECIAMVFNCAEYTIGLVNGTTCYSGMNVIVQRGACNGAGACHPLGCMQRGIGRPISSCASAGCVRPDACPPLDSVTKWYSTQLLCESGPQFTCTEAGGGEGCCSAMGDCCPAPMCTAVANVCR